MTTLTAAYGRKYMTQAEVKKDLEDGKDFIMHNIASPYHGKYCSINDFSGPIEVRYGKFNEHLIIFNCRA